MKKSRSAPMRRKRTDARQSGFTLLEVLIASAIGTVVIFALYLSFSSVLAGRSSIEAEAERSREMSRFVDAFTNEVSSAYLSRDNKATFFRGEIKNGKLPSGELEFTAFVHPSSGKDTYGDLAAVRYSVSENEHGQTSLFKEVWNPYGIGKEHLRVEVIEGIKGFDLSFYNGSSWSAAWDGKLENKTPEAVRATVKIMDRGAEKELSALARSYVR